MKLNGRSIAKKREEEISNRVNSELKKVLKRVEKFYTENPLEFEVVIQLDEDNVLPKTFRVMEVALRKKRVKKKKSKMKAKVLYYSLEEIKEGKIIFFLKPY